MTMSRPLRILHIHCRYRETGGEDRVVDTERRMLRDAGYDVVALDAENPTEPAATVSQLLAAPWNPMRYAAIRRLVRDRRPDIAHVHNTWFALSPSILRALRHAGIPVLMTVHNYRLACVNGRLFRNGAPCTDCVGTSPWSGILHRCYRDSAVLSAAVAGTTLFNRLIGTWDRDIVRYLTLNHLTDKVLQASGVPAAKLHRTANFVTDPGPRPAVPSASRNVVFVGRLSTDKGVDLLLDAWHSWPHHPQWTLTVAGDGPLRSELEARSGDVRFVGLRSPSEVRSLLQGARTMVVPSLAYENQPMVALEAFAAGLPVLSRDFGGIGELVSPLGANWLVVDGNPRTWTDALDIIVDPQAVDGAGALARREFERRYSPAAAAERAYEVYNGVLTERHTRRGHGDVDPLSTSYEGLL